MSKLASSLGGRHWMGGLSLQVGVWQRDERGNRCGRGRFYLAEGADRNAREEVNTRNEVNTVDDERRTD